MTGDQFSCSAPPRVFDAVIEQEFRDIFDENESVVYNCIDSYTMIGRSRSTCSKGTWTEPPSCGKVICFVCLCLCLCVCVCVCVFVVQDHKLTQAVVIVFVNIKHKHLKTGLSVTQ